MQFNTPKDHQGHNRPDCKYLLLGYIDLRHAYEFDVWDASELESYGVKHMKVGPGTGYTGACLGRLSTCVASNEVAPGSAVVHKLLLGTCGKGACAAAAAAGHQQH